MLKVEKISFSYLDKITLSNINFNLKKGNILGIIGESGCGKSTLLKCIYGLYDLDEGAIYWDKIQILGPKFNLIPGMQFIKYLAQDYDLMPYVTVAENVGKYLSNIYKDKKQQRIYELIELVEMTEYAQTKATFLSGGQMQRVALAKALALEPELLLLDEPFSNIDNFRKNNLRRKLFRYLKEKNITTIIATHDSNDIFSYCNEVLVLKDGKALDYATPKEIYNKLCNEYTASLLDEVNVIEINNAKQIIYPHQLKVTASSGIKAKVSKCYFKGSYYLIEAIHNDTSIFFNNNEDLEINKDIFLKIDR